MDVHQDIAFQVLGLLFVAVGSLLIYQGPSFLNKLIILASFVSLYYSIYRTFTYESIQALLAEHVHKDFQTLIQRATPAIIAYFGCGVIGQSLDTMITISRLILFSAFGYSWTSLIVSAVDDLNIKYSVFMLTTNIPFLSVEQNLAFCVLMCCAICYTIYQKWKITSVALFAVGIAIAISYFSDVPQLQQAQDVTLVFLSSHTQNVSISLKVLLPITGMIFGVFIGYHGFSNQVLLNGACMVLGIASNAFGFLNLIAGTNNQTLIPSVVCFTTLLLIMGISRKIYIPSAQDLRVIVKRKIKQILHEKQRKKAKRNKHILKTAMPTKLHLTTQQSNTAESAEILSSPTDSAEITPKTVAAIIACADEQTTGTQDTVEYLTEKIEKM